MFSRKFFPRFSLRKFMGIRQEFSLKGAFTGGKTDDKGCTHIYCKLSSLWAAINRMSKRFALQPTLLKISLTTMNKENEIMS